MQIAIAVGEPSGDILAAGMIQEIKRRHPDCEIFGIGGPKMKSAGCQLLYSMDAITVMGFDEALKNLAPILKLRRQLGREIIARKPDVFVGVDAPDFNIGLALKLKRAGIKTVHYVSPTVWAWRSYRIHKIKRAVDHMLTLFPFEKDYYDKAGVKATFVGHPAAKDKANSGQSIAAITASARAQLNLNSGVVIGLMPGSRSSEFERLLAPILDAAHILQQAIPGIQFVMPFAKTSLHDEYSPQVEAAQLPITTLKGQSDLAMQASDVMILASGTAALEALLQRVPMVVVYKVSAMSYRLFRFFARVKHFSMPNHLLDEPCVPELSQDQVRGELIASQVRKYLDNPADVAQLQVQFSKVAQRLALDSDGLAADVVLNEIGLTSA